MSLAERLSGEASAKATVEAFICDQSECNVHHGAAPRGLAARLAVSQSRVAREAASIREATSAYRANVTRYALMQLRSR
jgi:uncharacterized membrane protein YqiK